MLAAVFPDSEALICDYLRSNLGISVTTDVPNPRPTNNEFIRLIRTGGPALNQVADGPQITLESWHDEEQVAYANMANARALVNALPGLTWNDVAFYRVTEFTGPQGLPDPDTDIYRYVWTFRIGVRGTQLSLPL